MHYEIWAFMNGELESTYGGIGVLGIQWTTRAERVKIFDTFIVAFETLNELPPRRPSLCDRVAVVKIKPRGYLPGNPRDFFDYEVIDTPIKILAECAE